MKLVLQIMLGVILGQAAWTGLQLLAVNAAFNSAPSFTAPSSRTTSAPAEPRRLAPLKTTTIQAKPPCVVTNEAGETFACPSTRGTP